MFEGASIPPPQNQGLNLGCSEVDLQWLQSNFVVTAVKPPPPPTGIRSCSEVDVQTAVQLCSDCSQTPPPESGVAVKLMCSDCSPTLQWLQSNPWWDAVSGISRTRKILGSLAHQYKSYKNLYITSGQPVLCTECLRGHPFPPPPPKSGVELGLQWSWSAMTAVQLCSDCSQTPPPTRIRSCSEVDVQWMQLNPPPGIRSCSEVDVQWLQSNFAVTAVKPPPPESGVAVKLMCSDCSPTLQWLQVTPPHQNQELQWSWCAVTAVQLCSDCSRTPPVPYRTATFEF